MLIDRDKAIEAVKEMYSGAYESAGEALEDVDEALRALPPADEIEAIAQKLEALFDDGQSIDGLIHRGELRASLIAAMGV